ncbi:MAG TPA: hypothetical protein VE954_10010 [Oligoflexus sp.]|uniref:hypothetical protein n=1 Tax=Oligoflexus sp. TaxID=1971216 RepID=UPI002D6D9C74|nr:hypothetical protein [Oligoflexus sp.]HYX33437.1 hypothetical protein [Oligoflexus sp.]
MSRRKSIPILATLLLNACHPIVVRVGERTQSTGDGPQLPYTSEIDTSAMTSWNSVEDFLQQLDTIKKLGRDALIKRYHEDGRQTIRQAFRQFRDAVEDQASRDVAQDVPYLGELEAGACVPISARDIFDLEVYGDLRAILETVFLSRIQPAASVPNPTIPGAVDEITKLGFFELGIAMDGASYYRTIPNQEILGSDLQWKVIHEQNEPESWIESDQRLVAFHFYRRHEQPDHTTFRLEARVGPELVDGGGGSLPTLVMDYHKTIEAEGQSYQEIVIQSGWRETSGLWQKLQLSRRIVVSQDINQGRILYIAATEQWKKPGAILKKFRIDMDARSLCSDLSGS